MIIFLIQLNSNDSKNNLEKIKKKYYRLMKNCKYESFIFSTLFLIVFFCGLFIHPVEYPFANGRILTTSIQYLLHLNHIFRFSPGIKLIQQFSYFNRFSLIQLVSQSLENLLPRYVLLLVKLSKNCYHVLDNVLTEK